MRNPHANIHFHAVRAMLALQNNQTCDQQELIEEHKAFTSSIGDAEQEKNSILEYSGTAADPETGNSYTSVSPNVSPLLFIATCVAVASVHIGWGCVFVGI